MKQKIVIVIAVFFALFAAENVFAQTLSQLVDQYEQNCAVIETNINAIVSSSPALNYLLTGNWQNSRDWTALQQSLDRDSQIKRSLERFDTEPYDARISRAGNVYRRGFNKLRDFLYKNNASQYAPQWCPIN
jgi:hypothetical protein